MPATTRPGAPYWSARPVPGRAVEVATTVSWASAAWVRAAPTVAVAGSGVLVPGVLVKVASAITGVWVGGSVLVAVGKQSSLRGGGKGLSHLRVLGILRGYRGLLLLLCTW